MTESTGIAKPFADVSYELWDSNTCVNMSAIEFVAEFGEIPRLSGSVDDTKTQWAELRGKLKDKYPPPEPRQGLVSSVETIHGVSIKTYFPTDTTGTEPVVIYFHSGGFVMGSVEDEDGICRLLCHQGQMKIVGVDYSLAPVNPFPAALDECVMVTRRALEEFNVKSLTLVGLSAGGNLAFATALRLIGEGMAAAVKGVVAVAPVTLHPAVALREHKHTFTAYGENDVYTINSKSAMGAWLQAYHPPPSSDPLVSVVCHPNLQQLKKVYITEFGLDTLRDDARMMKAALEKAQVPVKYDAYPGYPHLSFLFPSKHLDDHRKEVFGNLLRGIAWIGESE